MGRIMGLEHEYAALGEFSGRMRPPSATLIIQGIKNHAEKLGGLINSDDRLWLPNGGCLYHDFGHPEYATPECASVRDAVLYSRAGDIVLRKIFPNLIFFKNNLSSVYGGTKKLNTFGCHENYWTAFRRYDDVDEKKECAALLMPFLASRQIIDGAGWVNNEGDFFLSQRAQIIHYSESENALVSGLNHPERPIFKFDDWVGRGRGGCARLHLSVGDANILDFCLFLKMGITSLVISMFEDGALPDWTCDDPQVFAAVSRDLTGREDVIELDSGKCFSALAIQNHCCKEANRYLKSKTKRSSKKYKELELIAGLWHKTLKAIATDDLNWLVGRLDHRTKRFLMENAKTGDNPEHRRRVDLAHHKINEDGLGYKIRRGFANTRLVEENEVLRAAKVCPSGSRAEVRGRLISKVLREKNYAKVYDFLEWDINWQSIACWGAYTHGLTSEKIEMREMLDPSNYKLIYGRRFFEKLKKLFKRSA
ncbi:MAG: proteasome accessory factor PafA2 family protein [Patescibacteria group bacterium]